LQGHVEALADQESAWIAALEGRLAAVRHALVSLRHGVERLQARHPEDRVLRRSAAVDAGRTELRAASEWIAVVDSLQDWWQHGLRQRVQSILHETEPAMLASRIEALQAELAALQARSAALLARLQDGDLRERRAVQQAVARLHGLRSDRDEAVRQWDMASQAVQQQARRRWSARRRGYIEAADDARVTAIFLSARRSSGEGALRQWRRATQSLQEYLALHPHGVRADEMWRRLAESHLQHATLQYTSDLARYLQNGGSESDAPLPVQDYADALEALDQLLQQFPQSPHVADAHFQSGFLLAEMGSPRASSEHLERFLALVDSSEALWGRAALRIADNHLQLSQRTAACSAYARAARGSDAEAADVALFKLGWCHYDQEHPEQARQALRALLERAATSDSSRAADLQPEALELLALAFADDHEVSEAASVLERWGQPAWSFVVKRRMAQLFAARAQYDEAIRGYQSLLQDHAMDPRMAGAVEEWLRLVAVHRGEAEAHELAADLALHFTPQGEWARHAASPQQGYELEPAWQSRLVEEDRQAARSDSVSLVLADPQRAATRMAAHLRAAAVFAHRQALVDSTHRSVSLDQAVQRYRDLLQRFPGADKEAQTWLYLGEARAAQGDPLAAADAYGRAQAHPRADSTVVAQARGGELVALDAAAARRLPGALERYEATARRLTDEKPRDPQGWNALERVGELAFHAADWERSEAAYVDLAEGTRDDARAARALKIAGDTWWRRDDALRAGQRYARAYPVAVQSGSDSLVTVLDDLIPGAWMQAAANRQEHDRGDAIELYERVAQDHPAHELAPRALYSAAQLRSAEGDLEGALHDHALLLERYPEDPLRKDARLESARLAEAVHQPSRAASHLEAVLSDLSQEDDRIAARLHIAALRLEAGQPQQADEQYARVLERVHPPDGAPRDSALAADLWMRRARLATQGPQRAAHYAHALECASQLSDADAAEARFFVTDSRRPAYEDLTLTQPIDATLEAKKAALEVLVAGYGETLQRGVHPWHAAASLRLGESLAAFGDALRDSEPPSGLEGDDLWGWQEAMNLQAQSLEDRAVATWSLGLRGARDAHEDDAWTTGLRDRLYPMLSRRVPTQPVPQFVLVVPHED
jgi:tetratricopeptide (TPR) repeat protein